MSKVTVNHIYKIYPGEKGTNVTAVEDVNLEIADREFVVLVGPFRLWQIDHPCG